jgi:hypothetical protein
MIYLILLFISLLRSYCQNIRIIEYKNGTHGEISSNKVFFKKEALSLFNVNAESSYNFAIVLYNCVNETINHDLLYAINDYMYYKFFPLIKRCSNNKVKNLNTILYGPYNTILCNEKCNTDLLEERALEIVKFSIKQPYVISVILKPIDCNYLGIADVNGKRIVINGLDNLLNINILLHEWGHNLGLRHAGTKTLEYGDNTCIMGNNIKEDLCFNPAHSHILNWINVTYITGNGKIFKTDIKTPFLLDNKYYIAYYKKNITIYEVKDNFTYLVRNLFFKLQNTTINNLFLSWKLKNNRRSLLLSVKKY